MLNRLTSKNQKTNDSSTARLRNALKLIYVRRMVYPSAIQTTLLHQEKKDDNPDCSPFFLSNDSGLVDAIKHTFKTRSHILPPKKKSIAFTIGEGHFLSVSRYIQTDAILHVDISKDVIDSLTVRRQILLDNDCELSFKKAYHSKLSKLAEYYEIEKINLGEHHVFASEASRKSCQESLKRPFSAVRIDLFNPAQVKELAFELRRLNYVITYLNITNLLDYDHSSVLISNLKLLPIVDHPHFIFSTRLDCVNRFLHNKMCYLQSTARVSFDEIESLLVKLAQESSQQILALNTQQLRGKL